jgi:Na+/H+-translocating membrane pyrophosphatase
MSDFTAFTQALVDSTSTAVRTMGAAAEKLAPHAANAFAARAVVGFVIPGILSIGLSVAAFFLWQHVLRNGDQTDEGDVGGTVFLSILAVASFIFTLVALGDAAAAYADPLGFMILKMMGK